MKRLIGCALFVCVFLCLRVAARAQTYTDDFTDSVGNSIKSYSSLAAFPLDTPYWAGLPDRSAVSFSSTASPLGYATYRVQNARQITVGFYTPGGSFVSHSPYTGEWMLGFSDEDRSASSGSRLLQADYSPSAGAVYAAIDGTRYKAVFTEYAVVFEPTSDSPGDLIGYAVNAYASADGRAWSRVSLRQSSLFFQPDAPFVYEELAGTVPAGTAFLRVELNDFTRLPVRGSSGSYQKKDSRAFNCLASVSIAGENLVLGESEPLQAEPVLPVSPEEAPVKSAAKEAKKAAAALPNADAPAASAGSGGSSEASSRYEGAKFKGIIESSSGGVRKSASSSNTNHSSSGSSAAAQGEDPELSHSAGDDTIYRIGADNSDDKYFTAGITVYIIVVTGALAFIVIAAAARKK